MLGFLVLTTASVAPITNSSTFPCEGIRIVEASTRDRPVPFATLRQQGKEMALVRNSDGRRVEREIDVTHVKAISGFSNCRFVYTANIDLACYVGETLAETDVEAIAAKLIATAEGVGNCLTNTTLLRSEAELGSTPSISFGGGPRQPFWQISMVRSTQDPNRIQPEVLVLGPAPAAATVTTLAPQRLRAKAKAKRRAR